MAPITVSIDYAGNPGETPQQHQSRVEKKLGEVGPEFAKFDNIVSSLPWDKENSEQLKLKLGLETGVVPVVIVFDRTGKVARRFNSGEGPFTYEKDVQPFVDELLKQQ